MKKMDQSMWRSHARSRTKSTSRSLGAVRGVQWTFSIHSVYLLKSQSENKTLSWSVWIHYKGRVQVQNLCPLHLWGYFMSHASHRHTPYSLLDIKHLENTINNIFWVDYIIQWDLLNLTSFMPYLTTLHIFKKLIILYDLAHCVSPHPWQKSTADILIIFVTIFTFCAIISNVYSEIKVSFN